MRTTICAALALLATGCTSEQDFKGPDGVTDPPTDPVVTGTSTTATTPDTASPEPTDTADPTTATTDTADPTTGTTDTGTVTEPDTGLVTTVCNRQIDAGLLALCTGNAAVLNSQAVQTIQGAIDAAAGQTVWVCPGTWSETLVASAPVELFAVDPTTGVTVIDGGGTGRVLEAPSAEVDGLQLQNGWHSYNGGGIHTTGALTLRCSVIADNRADYEGGGVHTQGNTVIEGTTFRDNTSGYEGGALEADNAWTPLTLTIDESLFERNSADYEGGAIGIGSWADDVVTMTDTSFVDNTASYGGGAVSASSWGSVSLTVTGGEWRGNRGAVQGGALELDTDLGVSVTFTDTLFQDNSTPGSGGAVLISSRVDHGTVLFDGVSLYGNSAGQGSGAIHVEAADFECIGCDLGTGADDNAPSDATGYGQVYAGLGAASSFTLP